MQNRPIQYFTEQQLENAKSLSQEEILDFLENFKNLVATKPKSSTKPISLRIPEDLLAAFKSQARLEGIRYQTKIVELIRKSIRPS